MDQNHFLNFISSQTTNNLSLLNIQNRPTGHAHLFTILGPRIPPSSTGHAHLLAILGPWPPPSRTVHAYLLTILGPWPPPSRTGHAHLEGVTCMLLGSALMMRPSPTSIWIKSISIPSLFPDVADCKCSVLDCELSIVCCPILGVSGFLSEKPLKRSMIPGGGVGGGGCVGNRGSWFISKLHMRKKWDMWSSCTK